MLMPNQDKEIKLELSFEEVNLVLKGLGFLPFKDVFELVGKIHEQANEQFRQEPKANNTTVDPNNIFRD